MKKIIKLAAAFAVSGAMLATVGCQQIYEDIDDINAEIEQIENTDIVMLRSEVQNCLARLAEIDSDYQKADAALKAELEVAIAKGDQDLIASATSLLNSMKMEYDGKIAAFQTQLTKDLQSLLDQISANKKGIADTAASLRAADIELAADLLQAVTTLNKADATIRSEFAAADTQISKALNDSIAKYAAQIVGLSKQHAEDFGKLSGEMADLKAYLEDLIVKGDSTGIAKAAQIAVDLANFKTLVLEEQQNIYAKLKADSTLALSSINTLKSQYLVKVDELAGMDGTINARIDSLVAAYNAKVAGLEAKDTELADSISRLQSEFASKLSNLETAFKNEAKALRQEDTVILNALDTLTAGVYGRISDVQTALCQDIKAALDSAVKYTDEKIEALGIEQKFADMNKALADSCAVLKEAILAAKAGFELDKYQEIEAAIKALKNLIQSIVSLPTTEYELLAFKLDGKMFGAMQITAAFEIQPAEAAARINKDNAFLHIQKGFARGNVEYNGIGGRIEVKDTVLTGDAITVEAAEGRVVIKANVPTTVVYEGVTKSIEEILTWYSLEVKGTETASFNDLQSEYVPATRNTVNLNEAFAWYDGDTEKPDSVGFAIDTVCYNSDSSQLGKAYSVKVASDKFIGSSVKTIAELSALSGDSLYVTYSVEADIAGLVEHADSAVADAKSKFMVSTPESAGDTLKVTAYPIIKSKGGINLALTNLKWTASRYFDKYNFGTINYTATNDWEIANYFTHEDSVKVVVDTTFYDAKDLAGKTPSATNHALSSYRYSFVEDSLYIHYNTKYAKEVQYDTLTFSIDSNDKGAVKIVVSTAAMPTVKAHIDTTIIPSVSYGDTLELAFTSVTPAVVPADTIAKDLKDSITTHFTIIGKDSLAYAAGVLKYNETYKDTLTVEVGDATHAPYVYEFDYAVKTTAIPFELVRKADAEVLQKGSYKVIDSTNKYQVDSINLADYYKVVYKQGLANAGKPYNCPDEETISVKVAYGADSVSVPVTGGLLARKMIPWPQSDTSLVTKATLFYNENINVADTVNVNFKTSAPIVSVSIKDSTFLHTEGVADTLHFCESNEIVEIVDSANVWNKLVWKKLSNNDYKGVLPTIDDTYVVFNVSSRKVFLGQNQVPVSLNDIGFAIEKESGELVLTVSDKLSSGDYKLEIDYKVRHLFDNGATDHDGKLTININPAPAQ